VTASDLTVLDLLDALLRIDSVNPGLDPAGAGEAQLATFIAGWGRAAGLRTQVLGRTPGRPSVILRGGQNTGGRRLLLCGHLDTVGLAGTRDALTPRVVGDRPYVRGAYDMKAGLAAALIACRNAALAGIDGEVIMAAVADEELASLGIQEVLAHLNPADIDAAVVTEPTERQVGTAHRGFVWTEVTITGVAAHGSRPPLGADAILAAGHHLVTFDRLDHQLRGRPHPFLGPGNLHASLITGGTDESTIPDRCVFTVERRTLPGETGERVEADVVDLLEQCRPATQHHRAHPPAPPADGDTGHRPHCAGAARRSRPGHDRGPHVVLGRLRLPVRRRYPHCALRTRRGRSPRRHRMGQPLRHQNHHHRPHPARTRLLLLSRPQTGTTAR